MLEILSRAGAVQPVGSVASPSRQGSVVEPTDVPEKMSPDFYLSPVIRFDSEALAVIFELRDSRSGKVTRQFPPEFVVKELRKNAQLVQDPFQSAERVQDPFQDAKQTLADQGVTSPSDVGSRETSANGEADQDVDLLV